MTKIVDVSGVVVQLVNAQPVQERFARWLTGRFVHSGLPLTDLAAIWFPPSPDCEGPRGLAYHSDDRFGGSTVVLCYGADDLASDRTASGWSKVATAVGFHELAHIWMRHHLDDETRAAFMERLGLTVWRNVDLVPGDSGVEHAADTIAWGLGGTGSAMYLSIRVPPVKN